MFEQLCKELTSFLTPFYITTEYTDIFEETILKLAGVDTQPRRSQFSDRRTQWTQDIDPAIIYLRIYGITNEDAEKLLNFFKVTHGDSKAISTYHEPMQPGHCYLDDMFIDMHEFVVSSDILVNKVLPLVKNEITRLNAGHPESLKKYQLQSLESPSIRKRKILDELTALETKNNPPELSAIIANLKSAINDTAIHPLKKAAEKFLKTTAGRGQQYDELDVLIMRHCGIETNLLVEKLKPQNTSYLTSVFNFFSNFVPEMKEDFEETEALNNSNSM